MLKLFIIEAVAALAALIISSAFFMAGFHYLNEAIPVIPALGYAAVFGITAMFSAGALMLGLYFKTAFKS